MFTLPASSSATSQSRPAGPGPGHSLALVGRSKAGTCPCWLPLGRTELEGCRLLSQWSSTVAERMSRAASALQPRRQRRSSLAPLCLIYFFIFETWNSCVCAALGQGGPSGSPSWWRAGPSLQAGALYWETGGWAGQAWASVGWAGAELELELKVS